MIDDDHRLVLLAENHAGAAPWYQLAYEPPGGGDAVPLPQRGRAELARRAGRELRAQPRPGVGAAVPHQPLGEHRPRPQAERRGQGQRLRAAAARARGSAQRIRHHLPNLLAINFYKEGDVFRVVDTLNGV